MGLSNFGAMLNCATSVNSKVFSNTLLLMRTLHGKINAADTRASEFKTHFNSTLKYTLLSTN
ncbi:hypothetical protein PLUTE_a3138 [Pseudoalteromonas luteoviolacea DSM 6061]|nr:hypothetical protein [Pseudoalteromonas luteoviolacea DSM 6061]